MELEETAAVPVASSHKQRAGGHSPAVSAEERTTDETASLNVLEIEADASRSEAGEADEEPGRRKKEKKKKENAEEEDGEKRKKKENAEEDGEKRTKKKKKSRERKEEPEPEDTMMDVNQIPNFRQFFATKTTFFNKIFVVDITDIFSNNL